MRFACCYCWLCYLVSEIYVFQCQLIRSNIKKALVLYKFYPLIKVSLLGFVALILIFGVGFFGIRSYFITRAENEAKEILAQVDTNNLSATDALLRITTEVHDKFSESAPSSSLILRLRPYLTSPLLPEMVRFPSGVIETVVQKGLCDNAARNLAYVLDEIGYQTIQWDMVQVQAAHSALLVTLPDNDTALLDPFYGTASFSSTKEKLYSPDFAQAQLRNGASTIDYFISLSETSDLSFYEDFENTWMAAQGDKLVIPTDIPKIGSDALVLGRPDGDSRDVLSAAMQNKMTPYWTYAGHKYNRSWVRVLRAKQPIEVDFTLVQDVESSVVTSEPLPEIEGRHMRWKLKPGEEIRFFDGRAERSFKRMNSYLDVDQIVVRRIN